MNINYNDCHKQKTTCTFHIQKAKKRETFLYRKGRTLRKKQDNFPDVFIFKKQDTLHYAFFMKFLILAYIQKA